MALQYARYQTFAICYEAMKQNGWAIEFIQDKEMKERVAKALSTEN